MRGQFPVEKFKDIKTPFYYYDVELLQETLDVVKMETEKLRESITVFLEIT